MKTTRRNMLRTLLTLIPASLLAHATVKKWMPLGHSGSEPLEAPDFNWEKNDKFYDLFVENGNIIDGTEMRAFLDWTPLTPERPRWAWMVKSPWRNGDKRTWMIVTYLDRDLSPVLWSRTDRNHRLVDITHDGEDFKFHWQGQSMR